MRQIGFLAPCNLSLKIVPVSSHIISRGNYCREQVSRCFRRSTHSHIVSTASSYSSSPASGTTTTTTSTAPFKSISSSSSQHLGFEVKEDKILFSRYQTLYERVIKFPNGKEISFDVYGNPRSEFTSVLVVPFHSDSGTITLTREYNPGINSMNYGFVAGMYERDKHEHIEETALCELEEEAHLKCGSLIPLITSSSGAIPQDKYSKNMFYMFLAIDCVDVPDPSPLDDEEYIEIEKRVPLKRVREIILSGKMNTCHATLGLLALDKLRTMGYDYQ